MWGEVLGLSMTVRDVETRMERKDPEWTKSFDLDTADI